MTLWIGLFALLLCPFAALAGPARNEVALGSRCYLVELPEKPKGAPVLIVLHGGGGNAAQIARDAGIGALATGQGYAVVYPQGSARRLGLATWNAGICCGYAVQQKIDDIAFLDAVVADVADRFATDPQAVFLTGMSNGSMMAERYAAMRPDIVRAVAGVAGTMDKAAFPVRGPVPLLVIHGTDDRHVPFAGGVGPDSLAAVDFTSVNDVIGAFAKAQGQPLTTTKSVLDPTADGMRVMRTDWVTSGGTVRIRLLAIKGGGHAWPGGKRAARKGGTRDMDATNEILKFFATFR